jgi:hypothetical protein
MAFDVTSLIASTPELQWRCATPSDFLHEETREEYGISVAEDVLVVGYPIGIKQGTSNLPLVRSGIIATRIGEPLVDVVDEDEIARERTVRGFLVDGGVIPGSSGSPVVLKPSIGRYWQGTIHANIRIPPFLLGIIAETRYAPVSEYQKSFAGLGLAFDAETIAETIELFFE